MIVSSRPARASTRNWRASSLACVSSSLCPAENHAARQRTAEPLPPLCPCAQQRGDVRGSQVDHPTSLATTDTSSGAWPGTRGVRSLLSRCRRDDARSHLAGCRCELGDDASQCRVIFKRALGSAPRRAPRARLAEAGRQMRRASVAAVRVHGHAVDPAQQPGLQHRIQPTAWLHLDRKATICRRSD